jgi:hypothetical protein
MGTITRSFANNITTSGVLLPASLTNNSIANVTAYNPAIATGNMVLLSTQTASNSASISFTTGINSTYKEYQFWFIDIHPATDNARLTSQFSTDGGSNYGVTTTTTSFYAIQRENGTSAVLQYDTASDVAQSTSFFPILVDGIDNDADSSLAGSLSLFNPSSTTYVKHFMINSSAVGSSSPNYIFNGFVAGYGNTTTAINAIQFKMSSGNIDDGTILMYGIK